MIRIGTISLLVSRILDSFFSSRRENFGFEPIICNIAQQSVVVTQIDQLTSSLFYYNSREGKISIGAEFVH